jgi:FkbM family methyltransferase
VDPSEFLRRAAEETSHVAVERDGAVFLLPTRQKAGVDRLQKAKWKEHRHLARALKAVEPAGPLFVDVGAHVGTTAIAAVVRFGFESAVAFEPEAENYRLLRANVLLNGLEDRIETFNVAVSNRRGSAELKLRPEFGAKHRLLTEEEPGATTVTVPLVTLDDAGLDDAQAGMLWLDVEGHEAEALEGASMLLERGVPAVLELIPRRLDLEPLEAVLARHYTHVVDLREGDRLPIAELRALAKRYKRGFTDVLVLRG